MVNKKKKAGIYTVLALLIVILGGIFLWFFSAIRIQKTFDSVEEVFYNPLMGFAPKAESLNSVGENTLVYVDITWREWEPEKGEYNIDFVKEQNNWEHWKQEEKNVVLRFLCDKPEDYEHMDIPDWLYEQTSDGVFYDTSYGKGYAPEYSNEVFIEAHRNAICALGKALGQDSFVAYVELGSLGHWGEWHMNYSQGTTRMPQEAVRNEYVKPYVEAFPNAKILARRPFPETAKMKMGVFNDMTGAPEDTKEWLDWLAVGGEYEQPEIEENLTAQPAVWEYAPVGGEFTSSLEWSKMLDTELSRTIELLKASHTTFIGPKCPVKEEVVTYSQGVSEVLKTLGYRYGVRTMELEYRRWSDIGKITLEVENCGVAPIYFPWKMYLYVYDSFGSQMQKIQIPIELTELYGGNSEEIVIKGVLIEEGYIYMVGIENPITGLPAVELNMKCESEGNKYLLFEF